MKNITLSADEKLIEEARKQAAARGRTLNEEFREWLAARALTPQQRAARYRELLKRTSYVRVGRKFTREEMNKR